ncbi:MAG: hypothetical protein QXK24_08935 [Ignisphaera sp.]
MSNPYAQTDSISICVDAECCIDLNSLTEIIDHLTKIVKMVQSSKCIPYEISNRTVNRLTQSKRAVLNAISSLEATIKSIASYNPVREDILSSLLNMATRLIECRNSVGESIDDIIQLECREEIQNSLAALSNYIDTSLIIILALILTVSSMVKVNQKVGKRLSSIAASMLFASMMNIHMEPIQKIFSKCFYREIKVRSVPI